MGIWRLQASWQLDTVAARDRVTINPHVEILNPAPDMQQICQDLLTGLEAITPTTGEIRVKAYDAQGTVPVYPQGDAILRTGLAHPVNGPREVAMCLSFYGSRNVKRQRGRIYLPFWFVGANLTQIRPTIPNTKIASMASLLQGLGGVDVDWVVYSRLLDKAFPVTNWWYDNEWDIIRSRGGRGTSRILGTTSEATTSDYQGEAVELV